MSARTAFGIGRGNPAAAVLVLLLAMAAWAPEPIAADAPASAPRTNLQITLWDSGVPGERAALSELLFGFQRVNPDVIVCLEWKDAALQADWIPRWCGGYREYAPDMTVMGEQWAWQNRHQLLALPDDVGRELRRDFELAVVARLPGRVRGIPWRVSTRALYYRSDLLAEAELSLPESMDGLIACAEALAEPPARYGLGLPGPLGGGEELLHALARAHGAVELAGEDGGPVLSDGSTQPRRRLRPDYESALETLVELQARGALQPETLTWSEAELVELFVRGRLAMVIAPTWAIQTLREAEDAPEWAVAPLPMAPGGSAAVAVEWMVAFADTDRQENAVRLMRYIAEKESQRMLAMISGVPATRDLVAELGGVSPWSAHAAGLNEADGVPLATWERLRPELADALMYAMTGRQSAREALAGALEIVH